MAPPRAGAWLLAACVALAAAPAAATLRRVPADVPDLQTALDLSAGGDTVEVAAGDYVGGFTAPAAVVVRGAGPLATRLLGGGSVRVVRCLAGSPNPTRIESIGLGAGSADFGGLLAADDGARVRLEDVAMEGGHAAIGGGAIYAGAGSSVDLLDASVVGCSAGRGGGLLALAASLSLSSVQVAQNVSGAEGGGVLLLGGSQLTWIGGSCRDNHALTDGGGLSVLEGSAALNTVTLLDNHADARGGGVHSGANSTVTLYACDLVGNRADLRGGALCSSCDAALARSNRAVCSLIDLNHCDVLQNQAPQGAAGVAEGESELRVVAGIVADHLSGLLCLDPLGQLDVSCSLVYGNGVDLAGSCLPTPGSNWVPSDPRFCDLPGRDLELCTNSPALTPGCGESYFGSHPAGCPDCTTSAAQRISWGALKIRYR